MTNTDGIEYTTMHDYKPTHKPVPLAVTQAARRADEAQKEYDDNVDEQMNNGEPDWDWTELKRLAEIANDADRELLLARDKALNPEKECTCTPDLPDGRSGRVCAVCVAANGDDIPIGGE